MLCKLIDGVEKLINFGAKILILKLVSLSSKI